MAMTRGNSPFRIPSESADVMPSPWPPAWGVDAPRTVDVTSNESGSTRSIRPELPAGTRTLRNPREKPRSSKPIPPSLGDRRMARGGAAGPCDGARTGGRRGFRWSRVASVGERTHRQAGGEDDDGLRARHIMVAERRSYFTSVILPLLRNRTSK